MPERERKPERKAVGPVAKAGFMLAALCFAVAGAGFVSRRGPLMLVAIYCGVGLTALTLVAALAGAFAGRRKRGGGKGAAVNHDDTTSTT